MNRGLIVAVAAALFLLVALVGGWMGWRAARGAHRGAWEVSLARPVDEVWPTLRDPKGWDSVLPLEVVGDEAPFILRRSADSLIVEVVDRAENDHVTLAVEDSSTGLRARWTVWVAPAPSGTSTVRWISLVEPRGLGTDGARLLAPVSWGQALAVHHGGGPTLSLEQP